MVFVSESTQTDNVNEKNGLEWWPHNKQHMVSSPTNHVVLFSETSHVTE